MEHSETVAILTIDQLVESTGRLLAMSRVVGEVLKLLDNSNSTQVAIANCLAKDPALVVMLLRLANSPAFAAARHVDSVERALTILGREQVRRLIIAGAITRASDRLPTQHLIPLETFWRHSAYCAVIARLLAEADGRTKSLSSTVFLGGLLHDLGHLVLFSHNPDESERAFLSCLTAPAMISPEAAETAELGFNHAELGGALAEHWGLPTVLCAILQFHHAPLSAPPEHQLAVSLVHLANTGAHLAELDSRDWDDAPPVDPPVWAFTQLQPQVLLDVLEAAQYQVLAVEALRDPS
ncbi:HDOD domain-containing protein [Thiospirillum jenense]|uniref:HDOD domain-containing protein n=2 Tax=Thiospirillum jenense TaxID=1653858 RepID=A0A839HDU6_9GAMM|nr:HDOD domain-containing protein [Thiospirillum jenense]